MANTGNVGSDRVAAQAASSTQKGKRKGPPPLAKAIAGVLSVAGIVAPDTVSRIVKRMIFTPARVKPPESAQQILSKARTEVRTVGGEQLYHYVWGESGGRALLVHGWSADARHLMAFVEPLLAAGYQVVALDLPAHGRSSGKTASVKHFQQAIINAAEVFGPFEGVIAHSLGAAAVTYALARGLQTKRVAFLSPVASYESVWRNSQRMLNLPAKVMPKVVRRAEKWLGVSFPEIEPAQLATSLSVPLLVVHDREDRESPFADAAALVEKWRGAQLFATEKLGHTRALRDPEVVRRVLGFVSGRA